MAITISGENNNDRILASDGVIDQLSGFNVVGVITATSFTGDLTGNVTGNVTGNLTGNVNHTSNLLLQISGSEKFRVGGSGQLGIGGANYGTSGQVLTSGGSGSAVSWSTISTDLINDSSPQLGGTLDANNNNIHLGDNVATRYGANQDLDIYHSGSNGIIVNNTGDLRIQADALRLRSKTNTEDYIQADLNGHVRLYYDNSLRFRTDSTGIAVVAPNGTTGALNLMANGGNTNNDLWRLTASHSASTFSLQNNASGSWEDTIKCNGNGAVELYYDNALRLRTQVNHLELYGNASESNVEFFTVSGGTNYVRGLIGVTNNGTMSLYTNGGTQKMAVNLVPNGAVELKHNATTKFATTTRGIRLQSGLTSGNGISNMLQLDNDGNSNGDGCYITFSRAGYLRSKIGAIKNEFSNNETDIVFETTLAGSIAEKVRIPSTGGIELKTDGRGIKFPDTQTPTNAMTSRVGISSEMRYYESGEFVPGLSSTVLNGLQNPAFTDASYTRRIGRYVRVGNLVFLNIEILMANSVTYAAGVSDSVAPPCIVGIPFSFQYANRWASTGHPDYYPCAISYSSTGLSNDTLYAVLRRDYNAQPRIEITKPGSNGSRQYNSTNFGEVFPANGMITVSCTYCIDTNNADY